MAGIVEETPDTFVMETPDGRRLPIAKALLAQDQLQSYRSQLPEVPREQLPTLMGAAPGRLPNLRQVGAALGVMDPPSTPDVPKVGATPSQEIDLAKAPPKETAKAEPAAPDRAAFRGGEKAAPGPSASPLGMAAQATMTTATPASFKPTSPQNAGEGMAAKAFQTQQDALKKATEVGQQRATEEAAFLKQRDLELAQRDAQMSELQGNYSRARDAQMKHLTDLQTKLETDVGKVDPNRLWGSKTTGQKLMAAFGVFLGGVGGGPNQALGLVQKAINDDIAAQQQNIENRRSGLKASIEGQTNVLALMRQNFGDDTQALAATRVMYLDRASKQLETLASKFQAPELQAKAADMLGKLQASRAEQLSVFAQRADERARGWATLSLKQQELGIESFKAMASGKGGLRPLESNAATTLGGLDGAIKSLVDLKKMFPRNTTAGIEQYVGGTDASAYELQTKTVIQTLGKLLEGGVLKEPDYERYKAMIPTSGTRNATADQQFNALMAALMNLRNGQATGLAKAGYDTRGFEEPKGPASFRPN